MDYYIATTGNDGNDGSIGTPWLTLVFALTQVINGDTINIAAGAYAETHGTSFIPIDNEITILGPHAGVHAGDGARGVGEAELTLNDELLPNANNIIIDGLSLEGKQDDTIVFAGSAPAFTGIEIKNNIIDNTSGDFDAVGIFLESSASSQSIGNLLIAGNHFKPVARGIVLEGSSAVVFVAHQDVTIDDNIIESMTHTGIKAHGADGLIISNNVLTDCKRGIDCDSGVLTDPTINIIGNTINIDGPVGLLENYGLTLGHPSYTGTFVALIEDNTFNVTHNGLGNPWYTVRINGGTDIIFRDNTITYIGAPAAAVHDAIEIMCENGPTRTLGSVTIERNVIDGGTQGGTMTSAIAIEVPGLDADTDISLSGDFIGNWTEGVIIGTIEAGGHSAAAGPTLTGSGAPWVVNGLTGMFFFNVTKGLPAGLAASNTPSVVTFNTPVITWDPGDVYVIYYVPGAIPAGADIRMRMFFKNTVNRGILCGPGSEDVDARKCWWGSASGPSSDDPTGDPVTDPVTSQAADGSGVGITEGVRFWPVSKISLPDKTTRAS